MSRRAARATLAAALVALVACATADRRSTHGREATGTTAEEVPVRGYRAKVVRLTGPSVVGELLAVDDQRLWIELEPGDDDDEEEGGGVIEPEAVVEVPLAAVEAVLIELHPSGAVGLVPWTIVGTLGTITHGLFLIYSVPVWLCTGVGSVGLAAATDPELDPVRGELAIYARYPQGPPAGWAPGRRPPRPRLEPSEPPEDASRPGRAGGDTKLGRTPVPAAPDTPPPPPPEELPLPGVVPLPEEVPPPPVGPPPLHPPLDTRGPPP